MHFSAKLPRDEATPTYWPYGDKNHFDACRKVVTIPIGEFLA